MWNVYYTLQPQNRLPNEYELRAFLQVQPDWHELWLRVQAFWTGLTEPIH